MSGRMKRGADAQDRKTPKIVSSEHLAQDEGWELSEYEYGLIVAHNAFTRWMARCLAAVVGHSNFSALDVLVLHNVNHRGRPKRLSDICFVLNIEDQHTVTYALKKLVAEGLVEGERRGKERYYATTEHGAEICQKYRQLREICLLDTLHSMDSDSEELRRLATVLRGMSGLYDQAARSVASV
ncbi:putative MarR family transcription regulator [Limimaricola variabilis]|uniref:MarR family transcription regulator n=1 Tax=Limimaricola variabilis TaxID=1492771 RepID=A0ABR6HT46_9RHOB|nr:winged helix DNA-binding protein [Limimaricola variabilis]MBB3713722.1 putative MarR family transcription regulator [Limimaricola variabilis]WPY93272.1 winged helix DNA-binding protein [Limimaricola variabilis]